MRKLLHIFIFVLATAASCSPYDDSAILEQLRDHEERIQKLEVLCAQLNSNVEAMQTVLEVLQENDYATAVTAIIEDGHEVGYSITFAKSGTVRIYHAADGTAPRIGIRKSSDGEYYWTADEEWLTDENGDMFPVYTVNESDDANGADAGYVTPLFRVADGIWYISYDCGNTWQIVLPADESEDSSDGSLEDSAIFTEVSYDESNLYVTLADGTALTIPLRSQEFIELYQEAKTLVSRFQQQSYIVSKNTNDKLVDISLFAGQSNSCGRAQLSDCTTDEDIIVEVPFKKGFSFNNTASTVPVEIVEPISANGTSAYGYIPSFINAYHATTDRKVCACYKSVGGTMINKFVPYVLDDLTGEPTSKKGTYYKEMVSAIEHAKANLVTNGYEIVEILMVWCQGESEGVYLGNENKYALTYEYGLTTDQQKTDWYKKQLTSLVEQLKTDVGLSTAFIIRIGQRNIEGNVMNTPIIYAQNQLGKEHDNMVLVSTVFAGAQKFIKEDGTMRNLMRDTSHYFPEGYARAGLEAGVNAGIYINSNRLVKPILLEYHTLLHDDLTLYERPVDKFIYDPCRFDFTTLKDLAK